MLWLPRTAYYELISDANKWKPYETGGVFMGYISEDGDIVVTDMIDCGENSKHSRYGFCPDQEYQLDKIADIYRETNGLVTYLGDWHTHPNSSTQLSNIDKRTIVRVATTPEAKIKKPIMAVLGGYPKEWSLNVVQFVSGNKIIWPFVNCKCINVPHVLY